MSPQRSAAIRRSSGVLGDGSRFLQFDLGQSQGAVNCAVADLHGGPAAGGFLQGSHGGTPGSLPPSHHHFYRWYGCHSQSWVVYDTIEVDDLRVPPWLRKPPSKLAHKIYVTHIVVARMVVIHIPLVWSVKCLCSVNANCFGAVRRHFCWWNPFRSAFVLVKFELPMDSHGQVMVQSPFFHHVSVSSVPSPFVVFHGIYPLVNKHSHWEWLLIVDLPIKKWWFSIVILVYQRV